MNDIVNKLFILIFSMTLLQVVETPDEAFKRLKQGNHRFATGKLLHPDRTQERRFSLREGQSPYAVIVTCSDSRVVPEIIFDEGLGDFFVIRVAGNIVSVTELESVIYAVDHLNPSIIVVIGHESCGAVDAVVQNHYQDIPAIAHLIQPSVKKAKDMKAADLLKKSVELNAMNMRSLLMNVKTIGKRVRAESLVVHGAYYNLQTGVVDFLD
ncbi:MAG: carbonic anhydrase [Candidatus Neptunochlamydia sp.]|nr:carbonic anhydrase [Candidatus Neptunochlamydia sp.]